MNDFEQGFSDELEKIAIAWPLSIVQAGKWAQTNLNPFARGGRAKPPPSTPSPGAGGLGANKWVLQNIQ